MHTPPPGLKILHPTLSYIEGSISAAAMALGACT